MRTVFSPRESSRITCTSPGGIILDKVTIAFAPCMVSKIILQSMRALRTRICSGTFCDKNAKQSIKPPNFKTSPTTLELEQSAKIISNADCLAFSIPTLDNTLCRRITWSNVPTNFIEAIPSATVLLPDNALITLKVNRLTSTISLSSE